MDRIATIKQAAEFFQCSPVVLQHKCSSGEIENAVKVCGKWFINMSQEWPVLFGKK